MSSVKTAKQLIIVDVTKTENLLDVRSVDIGFGVTAACKGIQELGILSFRKVCRNFLVSLFTSLVNQKSPFLRM